MKARIDDYLGDLMILALVGAAIGVLVLEIVASHSIEQRQLDNFITSCQAIVEASAEKCAALWRLTR